MKDRKATEKQILQLKIFENKIRLDKIQIINKT